MSRLQRVASFVAHQRGINLRANPLQNFVCAVSMCPYLHAISPRKCDCNVKTHFCSKALVDVKRIISAQRKSLQIQKCGS
jgi:hypothetical protein